MSSHHHIVVVGAGFGGLEFVRAIAGSPVEVTLIDQRNHHLFQPLLYQVATTSLATSEIAWPIRHLVRRYRNITTLLGTVTGVDADEKKCGSPMAGRSATTRSCWQPARAIPISATTNGKSSLRD